MNAEPATVTVGLIDNDPFVRGAARAWLAPGEPDVRIRRIAGDVAEYLAGEPDDVVLLDLDLKDGTRFVDNIARLVDRGCRVLLVSVHTEQHFKIDAVRAGAVGYLVKSADSATVLRTIREIADGTYALDQELAFAISRDRNPDRPRLAPQEAEVLRLRGRAVPMKVVAERLGVTVSTAYGYLRRVKDKYAEAGRPFGTLGELQQRLREDGVDL